MGSWAETEIGRDQMKHLTGIYCSQYEAGIISAYRSAKNGKKFEKRLTTTCLSIQKQ